MKLILQIAAGVLLGSLAASLIKTALTIGSLTAIADAFNSNPQQLRLPELPAQHRYADEDPHEKTPPGPPLIVTAPYTVRKATPEDAAAKPAR
ncbi:MAG: hypothetical protein ACRD3Q_01275 [Terriglobales bacterium]